jgi:hypothetical protein
MLTGGLCCSVATPVATGGRPHWSEDATKEIMVALLLPPYGDLL